MSGARLLADAKTVPRDSTIDADICIIGAGAAGITLAREFIGRQPRVVILESGGLESDPPTQALYDGTVTGLPYFPLEVPRLRYFGGTTNHWAGVCRPFDAVDFEQRDWIPRSGWPFGKVEMDPYYARAQQIVQVASQEWATDAWVARDRYRPLPLEGDRVITRVDQIVPPGLRDFGTLYGDELRSATNVTVYLWANATDIVTAEDGATVSHIEVATLSGNRFEVAARTVVLAVGGIENPRMLLASRDRHPNGIGNQHDLVGRFFLEHPRFVAGVATPTDPNLSVAFYEEHEVDGSIIQPRLAISRQTQEAEGLSDVQIKVDPVHDVALERAADSSEVQSLKALRDALGGKDAGALAQHLATVVTDMMTWNRYTIPGAPLPIPYPDVVGELMKATPADQQALVPGLLGNIAGFMFTKAAGDLPVEGLVFTARFDPVPDPESRVTLSQERDELGLPRPRLDWQLAGQDRHSVRRSMEILAADMGRSDLGRVNILFHEEGNDWPSDLAGGFHHMGTTRMHDDPAQGVVDADGLVHGMSNLYVAGSSVFPTAGSGNPTMLIVALALRLAEHLDRVMA